MIFSFIKHTDTHGRLKNGLVCGRLYHTMFSILFCSSIKHLEKKYIAMLEFKFSYLILLFNLLNH